MLITQYGKKRKRNQPLEGGEVAITHYAIHQDEEEKPISEGGRKVAITHYAIRQEEEDKPTSRRRKTGCYNSLHNTAGRGRETNLWKEEDRLL